MNADLLDLVLILLAVAFGVSGYRQGLIIGATSLAGFIAGGALGAIYAPELVHRFAVGPTQEVLYALLTVFLAAVLGQFLASSIGILVRNLVTWHPARVVDALGGAAAGVVALLLMAWLLGTAILHSPFPVLAHQVRNSQVLRAVDQVIPETARTWFSGFRRLVDQNGFPPVFGTIGPERIGRVPPPDPDAVDTPAVHQAQASIVKVTGTAPACSRRVEGTGFFYAPHYVMTNAHVVAGVRGGPEVLTATGSRSYSTQVVEYDPRTDVAVLYVPGADLPDLDFAGSGRSGASAVVAGFPQGHGFTAKAARIRSQQQARGPDIYQSAQVTRDIYAVRSRVRPGNSGGPLLSPGGDVYGVIFAASADTPNTGYALTASEVASEAREGRASTQPVPTGGCD